MGSLYTNFAAGTITDNPLTNVATTINSAGFASLPAVANGDWRRSSVARVHANAADWTEDFALHQDKLADQMNKGGSLSNTGSNKPLGVSVVLPFSVSIAQ